MVSVELLLEAVRQDSLVVAILQIQADRPTTERALETRHALVGGIERDIPTVDLVAAIRSERPAPWLAVRGVFEVQRDAPHVALQQLDLSIGHLDDILVVEPLV